MQKNSPTIYKLRKDLCLSLANLLNSQKEIAKKSTRRNANYNLQDRTQRLEVALIAIQDYLLNLNSCDNIHSQSPPSGQCRKHPRLGLVTWETAGVPCPVCERNDFVDSQLAELERQFGHKEHAPMWNAYFNLWDPSRPLMYWTVEMRGLPRNTRDCIRYLGDYIDMLIKELTFETLGKGRTSSLSSNAKLLLSKSPENAELAAKLVKYSDFLYTPGKHDFRDMPFGRVHRFSAKEVVITCYITARLAKQVLDISAAARNAVEKDNLYSMSDKGWGRGNRVHYEGSS